MIELYKREGIIKKFKPYKSYNFMKDYTITIHGRKPLDGNGIERLTEDFVTMLRELGHDVYSCRVSTFSGGVKSKEFVEDAKKT